MRYLYLLLCFSLLAVGCSGDTEQMKTAGLNELTKRYGKTFEVKDDETTKETGLNMSIWNATISPKDAPDVSFQVSVHQKENQKAELQYENFLEAWWNAQVNKDIEPKVRQLLNGQDATIFASTSSQKLTYPDGKIPTIAELRKGKSGYPQIIVGIDMTEKLTQANLDKTASKLWDVAQKLQKNQFGDLYLYLFSPENDPNGPIYYQQRADLISLEGIKFELGLAK